MGFWLQLGASGFRIDAAPFVLEQVEPGVDPGPQDFSILDDWRQDVQWRRSDAVLLCEANVERDALASYCGSRPDGPNDRAHMLFDFLGNAHLWLALARGNAEPLIDSLNNSARLPAMAQYVTFLRNHDELDLSRLTSEQRADVFRAFAPREDMQIFQRGIRRRLASMLGNDRRRIELAYSLMFSMPGTPMFRYGDEIGMAEDLALPGRDSLRTPMQWAATPSAGFSTAPAEKLLRPAATKGRYGARKVNVFDQQRDPGSLLRWFSELVRTLRECPEIGVGTCEVVDAPMPSSILAHRFDAPEGSILLLHNLADREFSIDIGGVERLDARPSEVFADGPYAAVTQRLRNVELRRHGYRWLRLRRSLAE
jgi:maltose alpha-D-glucosyltransferase/alpha-amylase